MPKISVTLSDATAQLLSGVPQRSRYIERVLTERLAEVTAAKLMLQDKFTGIEVKAVLDEMCLVNWSPRGIKAYADGIRVDEVAERLCGDYDRADTILAAIKYEADAQWAFGVLARDHWAGGPG